MAYTREQKFSAFEIVGPVMIGPSSSHTAGAVRLGNIAAKIAGGEIAAAAFTLHGSFAQTARGHGTDRALIAGILGLAPDDSRIRHAFDLAKEQGLQYTFEYSKESMPYANTVKIAVSTKNGKTREMLGVSIGGGNILVTEIDGLELEFSGEYPGLVVSYQDEPGMIAGVSRVLAEHRINIAFMRVFRHGKGRDAFMVMETDEPVPQEALREIAASHRRISDIFAL